MTFLLFIYPFSTQKTGVIYRFYSSYLQVIYNYFQS